MLKNILKIAYRNIWKNKAFSIINIIGLSMGLSAAFVIGAMIYYDLTFDKFHPDGERIYRVTSHTKTPENDSYFRGVPVPLGDEIKKSTAVERASIFFLQYFNNITVGETQKTVRNPQDIVLADENYFDVFTYDWVAGSPKNSLKNPNEVVLTELRAATYFPGKSPQDVLGKLLIYNDSINVKITGVVGNFNERSDFTFQEFISRKTAMNSAMQDNVYNDWWGSVNSATQLFVKLPKQGNTENLRSRLTALAKEHEDEEMAARGHLRRFHLQSLGDLHMNTDYGAFDSTKHQANPNTLIGLSIIALFLLLLGCINFINLNTAQATTRAKEIGIRKTLGSSRKQLIYQFLGETFMLTLAAGMVSILFSSWLFEVFSEFMPQGIGPGLFRNPLLILGTFLLLAVITVLSGFYPALVLSNFRPVSVLRNRFFKGGQKSSLRKYLTVFQFVIAQVFIIATLVVGKQMNYMLEADMGFKTKATAFVRTPFHEDSQEKKERFASAVAGIPQIQNMSLSGSPPASQGYAGRTVTYFADDKEVHTQLQLLNGDENYLSLYGIDLLAGRLPLNDSISEYVINTSAMKIFGFENPEDIIGERVKAGDKNIPIVGVMEDFNQSSLKSKIEPLAFVGGSQNGTVHFTLHGKDAQGWSRTIDKIEEAWKTIYPDEIFEVTFMDDLVKRFYEQERRTSILLKWATGLAILIRCLGLLGLVIHTTERRTKEIGIRKVLGATLSQLQLLLCKEFLILVGIAFAIAAPIAWWGMNNWLQDFAYKTDLSWWIFLLSGFAMLLISSVVVSIRTIAAANRDPVKSLRTE